MLPLVSVLTKRTRRHVPTSLLASLALAIDDAADKRATLMSIKIVAESRLRTILGNVHFCSLRIVSVDPLLPVTDDRYPAAFCERIRQPDARRIQAERAGVRGSPRHRPKPLGQRY